jgi:hypothetical protein
VPYPTTLVKLVRRAGPAVIEQLNAALVAKLAQGKLLRARKLRIDTSVVEADIDDPTDADLPADLRERLREPIDDLARWAQRVYRQRDVVRPSVGEGFRAGSEEPPVDGRSAPPDLKEALAMPNSHQSDSLRPADEDAPGQFSLR